MLTALLVSGDNIALGGSSTLTGIRDSSSDLRAERCLARTVWLVVLLTVKMRVLTSAMSNSTS